MVNLPSQSELKILEDFNDSFCLTIYVPYSEPSASSNPNRIEFKNLLQQAKKALESAGVSVSQIEKTLLPAQKLINGSEFWPMHREGLVLFMHPKLFRYFHIPSEGLTHMITVGEAFNLEPLRNIIDNNMKYFVLVLGHNKSGLYLGDKYSLSKIEVSGFPSNIKDALNIDEYSKSMENHEIAPAYMGKGSEATHEQYDKSMIDKDYLLQYFRLIDKKIHSFLQTKKYPLILAGVDYLLPIYRQVNSYSNLSDISCKGNFDYLSIDEIHKKTLDTIAHSNQPIKTKLVESR